MIELDGSFGEGGGAILRQALALSMLTGKEFSINNIRKNRPNPGLAAQHVACLDAAKNLCSAEIVGRYIGATEVSFKPGEFKAGHHKIDIGTAGSITLLLQSVLLPSIFCNKRISFQITGGTDVNWSQPFDYFKYVFLPQLSRYADIEASLFQRGYYPKGGGDMRVVINGKCTLFDPLPPITLLEQKKLLLIKCISHASIDLEQAKVAERQSESARLYLEKVGAPFRAEHQYSRSWSTGSGITLWALYGDDEIDWKNPVILGADSLGERNKKAEAVGKEAAQSIHELITAGAPVDPFLADQLIPFMAVAGGKIRASKITNHVRSNIYVVEKFLDVKFEVDENDNIIICEKKSASQATD
ncbi:RNA 3'-terminal phosphate cyclase [Candidatus Woesearchaeota archaeon]|nr:RNA 3'-terminal phosphate cyclase [Candidatus Woesearchaeota archaeon]